ncbi:hypothetical protein AMAG_04158 [Allomyces macrogynus ATCC 38327]|uniref:t-SNARE coiled-coil homology domain-containing protein n=1 Tax=Allomyces macrogynus (strain ATCC 38327) TaxID=578462 RepID=A0A0L0S7N2_ALLM3|nr:hypothetical protein AMAG_04158 [Allomyces macrogynus ATCC 38327]|eukprot:KNE58593.1 hypothetical protein AMAG_04158 [Allomyces macrogynus ATCC 38327]
MATRSRTALFVQCRHQARADAASSSSHRAAPLEKQRLIFRDDSAVANDNDHDHLALDMPMPTLPPAWVDIVDDVDETMGRIQHAMTYLDGLHKRHLLPGFADDDDDDGTGPGGGTGGGGPTVMHIEATTQNIMAMLQTCSRHIKALERDYVPTASPDGAPPTYQASQVHKNAARRLATQVADLSSQFRAAQANYLTRLKSRSAAATPLFSLSDTDDADDVPLTTNSSSPAIPGASLATVSATDTTAALIADRDREVSALVQNLADLATVFRDMQTLVVDQGTLVDRIDYHLDMAANHVDRGNVELDRAIRYQASATKIRAIYLLVLAIVAVMLIGIFRQRG